MGGATLSNLKFRKNGSVLTTVTKAPYTFVWKSVAAGSYSIEAQATAPNGSYTYSAPIETVVAKAPTVSLTAPANNSTLQLPGSRTITATASPGDSYSTIARVDFFANGQLIGTDTTTPYSFSWTPTVAGSYSLTAKATDSLGATKTSSARTLIVTGGQSTVVSLTSPVANQVFNAPASIALSASVQGAGTIQNLSFYRGTTLIGQGVAQGNNVYNLAWTNVAAGSYSLTARATDSNNVTTNSAAVAIVVNALPTVSITSPANNAVFQAGANIALTASASDTDGTISKVDFYRGATLIGTATAAPYSITWASAPAGTYSLTAVATDNRNATTTSAAVTVKVNAAPTVSLTSPANGATFTAPATINLAATATDTDGTIAQIAFYQGTTLIATVTSAPYTYAWSNVGQGSYVLSARATDNNSGITTSAAVNVTVNAAAPQIYYIDTDHLNTPRLVSDDQQQTRWRWNQSEPFGVNVPDENPSGLGAFEFNLRFPGQYADKETNLSYNYFRDNDPATGRYVQSDPIGIYGGINTYAYVGGNPIGVTDPVGLDYALGYPQMNAALNSPKQQQQCPVDDNCKDPIAISYNGVCRSDDPVCGQAMQAAGMLPPYYPQTKTYSRSCLLKFGIGVKATSAIGSTLVLKELATSSASWARVAAVANNPATMAFSAIVAADEVMKHCECNQ